SAFAADRLGESAERLKTRSESNRNKLTAILYEKIGLRDGSHANNPWLQELPDPISKVTWGNYACVSPTVAENQKLDEGEIIRVWSGARILELPVHIQPGQHNDCVAIALGYGRTSAGKSGSGVGVNAYPLVSFENGTFRYQSAGVVLEKTGRKTQLAS